MSITVRNTEKKNSQTELTGKGVPPLTFSWLKDFHFLLFVAFNTQMVEWKKRN